MRRPPRALRSMPRLNVPAPQERLASMNPLTDRLAVPRGTPRCGERSANDISINRLRDMAAWRNLWFRLRGNILRMAGWARGSQMNATHNRTDPTIYGDGRAALTPIEGAARAGYLDVIAGRGFCAEWESQIGQWQRNYEAGRQ